MDVCICAAAQREVIMKRVALHKCNTAVCWEEEVEEEEWEDEEEEEASVPRGSRAESDLVGAPGGKQFPPALGKSAEHGNSNGMSGLRRCPMGNEVLFFSFPPFFLYQPPSGTPWEGGGGANEERQREGEREMQGRSSSV